MAMQHDGPSFSGELPGVDMLPVYFKGQEIVDEEGVLGQILCCIENLFTPLVPSPRNRANRILFSGDCQYNSLQVRGRSIV